VAKPSAEAAAKLIALTLRRSSQTLLDLAEARIVLETHIARVAAEHVTDAQIAAMQETIDRIEENHTDAQLCVQEDIRFHGLLVEAAGNVVFGIMLAPLAELLRESRTETFRKGANLVLKGHRAVLKAVRDHDGDSAEAAMRSHLHLARENLMTILS
jgi:DNA-binding FadR family transcriptional regulator